MIKMNDIYYKVDTNLLRSVFMRASIDEQKGMITEELKKYLAQKLTISGTIIPQNNDLTINELLEIMADVIPEKKHSKTLVHFTSYLLGVAGGLQDHPISYDCEENLDLINSPVAEFNENGQWTRLIVHDKTSTLEICKFTFNAFQNDFMIKKDNVKKLGTISSNN